MSDKLPTIDEIIEGLKRASDWEYQGTTDTMPRGALTNPQAKAHLERLIAAERLDELKWLLDNHDSENSFGYFIQDCIKELERHNNE